MESKKYKFTIRDNSGLYFGESNSFFKVIWLAFQAKLILSKQYKQFNMKLRRKKQ